MAAIELRGVTKRYERFGLFGGRSVTALNDLDLTVQSGETFGFLGPNGAGKSTTIDVLLGYTAPTAGSVRVLGRDVATEGPAVRERVGVLPDGYGPIGERTGREHVEFAIEAKGADDDPEELIERVGMRGPDAYPVEEYSKGMAQRLMLAAALVGEPELLILDEPSTGLDPRAARSMRRLIEAERDRGATVFFSSHSLRQVEATCDRVAILSEGRLVALDSIENLRRELGETTRLTIRVDRGDPNALAAVRDLEGVVSAEPDGPTLVVECARDVKASIITTLDAHGLDVLDFSTEEHSLEDLFIRYTDADSAGGSSGRSVREFGLTAEHRTDGSEGPSDSEGTSDGERSTVDEGSSVGEGSTVDEGSSVDEADGGDRR